MGSSSTTREFCIILAPKSHLPNKFITPKTGRLIAKTAEKTQPLEKYTLTITLLLLAIIGQSQQITVNGFARDEMDQRISNLFVINKSEDTGIFGNPDGSFSISCDFNDTLHFGAVGFDPRTVSFKDSIVKQSYQITIYLERKVQRLAAVEIFAPRNLKQIQKDINELGYDEHDYMESGINALESPITFLYQQFSRTERSKRLVAQMENEDRKRELLKELFHHYIDYDIINLETKEFDEFVDYINVSDEFMKSCSQYDFLLYVKERYGDYKIWKRKQGLKEEEDYLYDKD